MEAELEVTVRDERLWVFLEPRREQLALACLVSSLCLARSRDPGLAVSLNVGKSAGAKCQRCWMRLPTVGQSAEHPALCHRCVAVLQRLATGGKLEG